MPFPKPGAPSPWRSLGRTSVTRDTAVTKKSTVYPEQLDEEDDDYSHLEGDLQGRDDFKPTSRIWGERAYSLETVLDALGLEGSAITPGL